MALRTLLNCSFSLTAYPTCFPLTQFTCNNGRCININWRCDNGEPYLLPSTRFLGKPEATAGPQVEKGKILDSSWGSLQGTGTPRIS